MPPNLNTYINPKIKEDDINWLRDKVRSKFATEGRAWKINTIYGGFILMAIMERVLGVYKMDDAVI